MSNLRTIFPTWRSLCACCLGSTKHALISNRWLNKKSFTLPSIFSGTHYAKAKLQSSPMNLYPRGQGPFPIMRHRAWDDSCWFIHDGSKPFSPEEIPKMLKVTQLTPEQRRLSISSDLFPHPAMVKELARGWTPERDEEFRRLDTLAAQARDSAKKQSPQQDERFIDHYFYFPKQSNAERAAQRLRAKDWAVEVKRGADGEDWLTLAKQPAPFEDDIEKIRNEMERLAEELGGEYDGWGAAVKDQSDLQ